MEFTQDEKPTRYTITSYDGDEIKRMLNSLSLQVAVDCLHSEVFRKHFKYNSEEYSDEKMEVVEKIWEDCKEHFEHVFDESY